MVLARVHYLIKACLKFGLEIVELAFLSQFSGLTTLAYVINLQNRGQSKLLDSQAQTGLEKCAPPPPQYSYHTAPVAVAETTHSTFSWEWGAGSTNKEREPALTKEKCLAMTTSQA